MVRSYVIFRDKKERESSLTLIRKCSERKFSSGIKKTFLEFELQLHTDYLCQPGHVMVLHFSMPWFLHLETGGNNSSTTFHDVFMMTK